ncbi:MAG: glutamine synthetase family protein, partial [Burkholderiaceae bacterium]
IRPGWEHATQLVIADLYENDGSPLALCGRSALKKAVADWQALGYSPKVGIELEAFAFQQADDGRLAPLDAPGGYVYSTGPLADPTGFLDAIWDRAEQVGFSLEVMTSEYDHPQFEFTLTFDDAVQAVDDAFLFRLMAREVALEHGVLLTFMPKPIADKGGNGLHINFSLWDKAGKNALATDVAGQLNALGESCVAGLMHHHCAMAGLLAPTVNSYHRLQPASLSGYWANWAVDHRGVTTRIASETGDFARIEHRMADGAANPYTAVATVLQAARLGLVHKYPLPPAETGDCFEGQQATVSVADNLAGALDALEADDVLSDAVGSLIASNQVFMKRDEIEKTAALDENSLRDFYIYFL